MSAAAKRYKYLRRIFKCHQMDFEFAIWQAIYLILSPQKVYRNFQYRKRKFLTRKLIRLLYICTCSCYDYPYEFCNYRDEGPVCT